MRELAENISMTATMHRPRQAGRSGYFALGEAGQRHRTNQLFKMKDDPAHAKDGQPQPSQLLQSPAFLREMIRCGERDYERMRDLPGLLHIFPSELQRMERDDAAIIVKKLSAALRAERRRGRSGHYRYSLQRHIGLMQALAAEKSRSAQLSHCPAWKRTRQARCK
nr:DUF6477 family protein [uncultured Cohaesibacter sp.]